MSAWVEDPREPSGWRWDVSAPDGDPSVTGMLPVIPPLPSSWQDVDPDAMPSEYQHAHGGGE